MQNKVMLHLKQLLQKAENEKERIKIEEPDNRIAWNYWAGYSKAILEIMELIK